MRLLLSPLAPGVPFARYAKSLHLGADYAEANYSDSPQVANALGARLHAKTAIPGAVFDANTNLASLGVLDPQTAQLLNGHSALAAAIATAKMLERRFEFTWPLQSDSGTGGGPVRDGSPIPVVKFFLDAMKLKPATWGSIVVLSEEVVRSKGSDVVVRDALLSAAGRTETTAFLDPSVGPVGLHPGAITYGAPEVVASGNLLADLERLLSAITTSGRGLTWFVRPTDLAYVAAALGAAAADVPRTLLGLPVIVAPNAPRHVIVLADLSEIAYAALPLAVDLSEHATLEMESEPTNSINAGSPPAPVPTELVSLFQSNSVGYKLTRIANWAVREGAVAYLSKAGSPA